MKQSRSSLAHDLAERAATALDEAHEMPPGDERTEAMQKAVVLRNASEIQHLFGGKRGAPTAWRRLGPLAASVWCYCW
jgi:hypothetical protein